KRLTALFYGEYLFISVDLCLWPDARQRDRGFAVGCRERFSLLNQWFFAATGGEGGIRTHGTPHRAQRFSRPPRSTTLAPLRGSAGRKLAAPRRFCNAQSRFGPAWPRTSNGAQRRTWRRRSGARGALPPPLRASSRTS